jgi:molybdenum cofactor cytidylyltransferase
MNERAADPPVLILAAGPSSRLGRPKQLLTIEGQPLIRYVLRQAAAATRSTVHVVLGANRELIKPALDGEHVTLVTALNWRSGMSASLNAGIRSLPADSSGVLVMLSDQFKVTAASLERLLGAWRSSGSGAIIASSYAGVLGVPAIFPARLFPRLITLQGDRGARDLMRTEATVVAVPMPEAAIDLNLPEDVRRMPG